MTGLCINFGTEVPKRSWAGSLVDFDVVLEPYHPLVKYGGFAETFPNARRYIYVNPTSVDPWELERATKKPPLIGNDERWNLPRLDLDRPEALDFAVETAVRSFALDDGQSRGLFVDDLDRMLPDRADLAIEYLARVSSGIGREPRWFLNRGFELWPQVEALDAVLLEDIAPHLVGYAKVSEVRWLRDVVLAGARTARDRGVRIHALSYADQENHTDRPARDLVLETEFAEIVDTVTTDQERRLEEWRINQ
jgi:hypothetical protein